MSLFSLLAEVLYVGHSLVGPSLPVLVEAGLVQMEGPSRVEAQIINGAPLAYSWDRSDEAEGVNARTELAAGGVDHLILTEAIPLAGQMQWNDSTALVARWAEAARTGSPEVKVWVYETWHSLSSGPGAEVQDDPGAGIPWRQRIDDDLALWLQIAGESAEIIPAGQAMGLLADEIAAGKVPGIRDIREMFSDDIHLSGKGLYFVAMVHLAALTGKSPEGLPAKLTRTWASRDAVISDAEAAAFQKIAWTAVQTFQQDAERLKAEAATDPAAEKAVAASPEETTDTAVVDAGSAPAAATPPPQMPEFPAVVNRNLMLGLAGVNDWSVQQPFLDVMKTARPWVGHLPGQWGGWEEVDLRAAGALDPDGWPLRVPAELTGLSTLLLTDLPADAGGVSGQYELTWEGKGRLRVEGRVTVLDETEGRMLLDYTPGPGAVVLTIEALDPINPIRRIKMVRADRAAALASGALFNPDWLSRIRGVKGVRFMDWMATNNSTLASVADRPEMANYTWARNGVPVEVIVALANELQAEPWLTLPHAAGDDLVRAYAAVVKAELDPSLRVWVELSNEVWNGQFTQAAWAEAMGKARWGQDATWLQFYALRAAEVMGVFAEGMGGTDRMVRVITTQTGAKGLEQEILNAPLAMAEGLPAPADSFDAYAVTGYFSAMLGSEQKGPLIGEWLSESAEAAMAEARAKGLQGAAAEEFVAQHRFDLALKRAAGELRNGGISGDATDSLQHLLTDVLPYHAEVAAKHGLKLVMYEGGTHVVGYGPVVEDERLMEFFIALNFCPEMGALYGELLKGWADISDQPFNAFVDVYSPNKWGSWGALRHLWDDNPRWAALAKGCGEC